MKTPRIAVNKKLMPIDKGIIFEKSKIDRALNNIKALTKTIESPKITFNFKSR